MSVVLVSCDRSFIIGIEIAEMGVDICVCSSREILVHKNTSILAVKLYTVRSTEMHYNVRITLADPHLVVLLLHRMELHDGARRKHRNHNQYQKSKKSSHNSVKIHIIYL